MITNFIYNSNAIVVFLTILLFFSAIFCCVIIFFRYFAANRKSTDLTAILSTINMLYSVLLGFIIFIDINNRTAASSTNKKEAQIIFSLNNEASFLPEPYANQTKIWIKEYIYDVIEKEWPDMRKGRYNAQAQKHIHHITKLLKDYHPEGYYESLNYNNFSKNLTDLNLAHLDRINFAVNLKLGSLIWFCLLLITTIIIISNIFRIKTKTNDSFLFLFFFCLTISTSIFLIIELDCPYRSLYGVDSQDFNKVLVEISRTP